jgi:DNA-binding SARP family transcriptional activator
MRALGKAGRRGEVEHEFQRLSKALSDSLDVEPAAETRRAYLAAVGGLSR